MFGLDFLNKVWHRCGSEDVPRVVARAVLSCAADARVSSTLALCARLSVIRGKFTLNDALKRVSLVCKTDLLYEKK